MLNVIDLNSNPLSLVRGLPVKEVPLEKVVSRNVELDSIFVEKYTKYLNGKLKVFATRVRLNQIKPGFYKPTGKDFVYVCEEYPNKDIQYIKDLIRLGDRPSLHLYHNINKQDEAIFVCPDDVAVFHAYHSLGINLVPVLILGSCKSTIESSIVVRGLKCTYNPFTPHIVSISSKQHATIPSLLDLKKPNYEECFITLNVSIQEVKERLKEFHKGGMEKHHYHHTLYSILLRAQETLSAMKILFDEGLFLNAVSLVRSLYELTLTFYVDWLAPTQMYKYLQLSSTTRTKQWEKECEKALKIQVKDGLTQADAKKLYDAKMFGFRLVTVVSEKARLFPMGEEHHQDIYAFLSKIVHHDFSMVARYTHTLEHGDETVFHEDAKKISIYCADIFTTTIVTKVIDDIGAVSKYNLKYIDG